jgi:hypothetical protein|eukprot:COSAG01_NODE_6454_length_3659_cov_3.918258_5_plen_81_part_00
MVGLLPKTLIYNNIIFIYLFIYECLPEYSAGNLALQDDPYTPSTHTSLESPRNGGINGYFTFEHGLLQGEPSIITSKWGF